VLECFRQTIDRDPVRGHHNHYERSIAGIVIIDSDFSNFLIHNIICETNLKHQDDMCSCFSIDIAILSNSPLLKILKVIYLSLR
jgi:hypothetical protein